jgi:hypothetical protein
MLALVLLTRRRRVLRRKNNPLLLLKCRLLRAQETEIETSQMLAVDQGRGMLA